MCVRFSFFFLGGGVGEHADRVLTGARNLMVLPIQFQFQFASSGPARVAHGRHV